MTSLVALFVAMILGMELIPTGDKLTWLELNRLIDPFQVHFILFPIGSVHTEEPEFDELWFHFIAPLIVKSVKQPKSCMLALIHHPNP